MDKDKNGTLDAKEVQAALNAGGMGGGKALFGDLKDEVKFEQFLLLSVQAEQRQGVVTAALPSKRSSTVAGVGSGGAGAADDDDDDMGSGGGGDDGMVNAISELLKGPATRASSATISIMNDSSVALLAGEKILINDHKTCSRVSDTLPSRGSLLLTNYRLVFQDFRDRTDGCIEMPLGSLMKVEKEKLTLMVICKDFRQVKFVFDSHINQVEALYKQIRKLAFPVDQLKVHSGSGSGAANKQ